MGCASSKDEAPSPARSDGGGGGGGGGNSNTVRNSFMSNDSAGSPEILKEVAPHTPLPTHAPPYARPRTHALPTHAPPYPRASLSTPLLTPPHARTPLSGTGEGGKKPCGRPSAGYTCGCTREPCAGGRVAERGWPPTAQKIFASVGKKEQFKAGETLIEEAKASDQCYYILKGTVSSK